MAAGSGHLAGSRSISPWRVMFRKSTTSRSSGNLRSRYRMAILSAIERLFLGGIDGLALNVAVGCFGQQVCHPCKLAIACVDFVALVAGNHKEGDAVANLRRPGIQLVEAEIDGGLGRVIPDKTVAAARHHERNADVLSSNPGVIVPALDAVIA